MASGSSYPRWVQSHNTMGRLVLISTPTNGCGYMPTVLPLRLTIAKAINYYDRQRLRTTRPKTVVPAHVDH